MTNLTLFDFNGMNVRSMIIDSEPWFIAVDVATVLGYSNTRDAIMQHVDDEDKNTVAIYDGIVGNPNKVVINESGVYSLIFSSTLPVAKEFKHWVTHEVLPSIRKQGYYSALSDKELIKLLQTRYKENPNFISASPFSDKVKSAAYEAAVRTQLDELWSKRTELSTEEYATALYKICKDDSRLARRESQRYKQWQQTKCNLGTGYRW